MKKILFITLLCCTLAVCGCAKKDSQNKPATPDDSNVIYISDTSEKPMKNKLVERGDSPEVSAPDGSISFEQACKLVDSCSIENFYLCQSLKDYQKYYFGTIEYKGEKYYSIYPCLEIKGKKIFMGTNCLVSCTGSFVLTQNWMGGYETVDQNTAVLDKDWKTRCPDAKVSPNEAITALVDKEKLLGLEHDISAYTFETDLNLKEINGIPCYAFTPKLEYTDHLELLGVLYVSADGTGCVYKSSPDDSSEYIEIK